MKWNDFGKTRSKEVFSKLLFFADPFWLRKITIDPRILTHVNIEFPDNKYPKLDEYISESI
jgi:hypothetical protein